MSDYIDRDELIKHIKDLPTWWEDGGGVYGPPMKYSEGLFYPEDVIASIENAPAANVQEIKYGKWIETQEPLGWCDVDCAECSVCHESWIIDEDSSIDDYECMWHYCPNCGAKMDGGNNNA